VASPDIADHTSTPGGPEPTGTTGNGADRKPSRRLSVRLTQFLVGSGVSTGVSQVVLIGCYGLLHASAPVATVAAFVAGAIPNFLINWFWTWARSGKPSLVKDLLPYFSITIAGGLLATALTTWADDLVEPHLHSHGIRTLVVAVVYLGSYALFFLLKFFLLDRLMATRGARKPQPPADADAS
jgi:putative flippase GtrA